jgi:hypothetical protein
MDTYTIYIQNHAHSKETFWCFLAEPDQLEVGSKIYANSSARMTLNPSSSHTTAKFEIPIQYQLAARSTNKATGLGIKISTENTKPVNLGQAWAAKFYTEADHQAPDLSPNGNGAMPNEVLYNCNPFNPSSAIQNSWYPSQTFGMKTESGFIGMSWEALPNTKVSISPNVKFYINTGTFHPNTLADYTVIKQKAAELGKNDFKGFAATVILKEDGTFDKFPGAPVELDQNLIATY